MQGYCACIKAYNPNTARKKMKRNVIITRINKPKTTTIELKEAKKRANNFAKRSRKFWVGSFFVFCGSIHTIVKKIHKMC